MRGEQNRANTTSKQQLRNKYILLHIDVNSY